MRCDPVRRGIPVRLCACARRRPSAPVSMAGWLFGWHGAGRFASLRFASFRQTEERGRGSRTKHKTHTHETDLSTTSSLSIRCFCFEWVCSNPSMRKLAIRFLLRSSPSLVLWMVLYLSLLLLFGPYLSEGCRAAGYGRRRGSCDHRRHYGECDSTSGCLLGWGWGRIESLLFFFSISWERLLLLRCSYLSLFSDDSVGIVVVVLDVLVGPINSN